jgi:hypothetical protein
MAVRLERVVRVFDLAQAALDVRKRDRGKRSEAAGMLAHELCGVLVRDARDLARSRNVAHPGLHAGVDEREERGRGPALVHLVEGTLGRPFRVRLHQCFQLAGIARRSEMVVHVDAKRLA